MRRVTRRRALAGIGALAGAALFNGCAINPVTGKPELMIMTEAQEIKLGGEAHGQILAQYGAYGDESIQEWFNERGQEMAMKTHRKQLPWKFTVLDSPVINAFAVPGGYVYVTRGILGYMSSEAQFGGVLGHELGHVNARHTAATYSKAQLTDLGLQIGSMISPKFAFFAQVASLGTQLLFLKFSRDDERQADQLGVEYSSQMGYDAVEMSEFFKTLERLSPPGGSLPAWQSTHPDPGDRINDTRRMAMAFQKSHTDMTFSVLREEYIDRINGLVYGDDPRQGFMEEGVFYHPEINFQFPVPADWEMLNLPTEVRFAPEKEDAVLVFTLATEDSPKAASDAFTLSNKVQVMSAEEITVNSMPAYKTVGQIVNEGNVVGINSYFIKMDEKIYVFHGVSASQNINEYDKAFEKSATGFGKIVDESKLHAEPERIEVRRIASSTTLRSAFNDFGVEEDHLDKMSLINGLMLDDIVPGGAGLKLVAKP